MHRSAHLLLVLACGWSLTSCEPEPTVVPDISIPPPPVVVEVRRAVAVPTPVGPPLVALPPPPVLGREGYQLILDHEVGGGRSYFERRLARPSVPPGESGVTIGVGYDLRFNSVSVFRSDWRDLPSSELTRLAGACGLSHTASLSKVQTLRDIIIQWNLAARVFDEVTLTRFYQLAKRTFPGMQSLDLRAQAVLVSLTFNRGSSMGSPSKPSWDSRREMRELRDLVPTKNYPAMARVVRKMKRLWEGRGMDGLLRRREDEARLLEACRP